MEELIEIMRPTEGDEGWSVFVNIDGVKHRIVDVPYEHAAQGVKANLDAMLGHSWQHERDNRPKPVAQEPLSIEEARGIAARCWCSETTSHLEMDSVLAEEFAKVLVERSL